MSIHVFYDIEGIRLKGWRKLEKVLREIISEKKCNVGDLNFIITGDSELRNINIEFLEHDYYTDVITFNYNKGNLIGGEIYISLDTVKINALDYKVSIQEELKRVIIHGVLHLLGMNDSTDEEKRDMRAAEDKWLKMILV